jgi:hypothetical protein
MSDAHPDKRPAGDPTLPPRPSTQPGCQDLFDLVKGPSNDPKLLRRLPRLTGEALALVWAAGRRELLVSVALKLTGGLGLAIVLLLGRGVLAGVLDANQTGTSPSTAGVLPRLVVLTGIIAILGFAAALGRETSTLLGTRTQRHAQGRIIDVACAVELEAYEAPAFHDRLLRASLGGQARPDRCSSSTGSSACSAPPSASSASPPRCWPCNPCWSRLSCSPPCPVLRRAISEPIPRRRSLRWYLSWS